MNWNRVAQMMAISTTVITKHHNIPVTVCDYCGKLLPDPWEVYHTFVVTDPFSKDPKASYGTRNEFCSEAEAREYWRDTPEYAKIFVLVRCPR